MSQKWGIDSFAANGVDVTGCDIEIELRKCEWQELKASLEGVKDRECEIPMDTGGQSVETSGQIIGILSYYHAHGRNRSHAVRGSEISRQCGFRITCKEGSVDSRGVRRSVGVRPGRSQERMMKAIESKNQRLEEVLKRPTSCHFTLVRGYGRGSGGWCSV